MAKTVIVIGGGISGLCCAWWMKKRGLNVTVLEKASSAGGTMKTQREEGWLIETGPNSALETTPLFGELFNELGITDKRRYANEAATRRYIVKNGTLHPLPAGPGSFITSKLWSGSAKLRLLKEPFIGRAVKEESIAEFVRRRLGDEFLDYAIDPFVAGVYAGDPAQLSVQSAFPKLYALEKNHGGLIRGAIASRKERKQRKEVAKDRARLFSFADGMETLPAAIATGLGDALRTNTAVEHIVPMRAGKYPVYTISMRSEGEKSTMQADAIVLAAPARATASMIRSIDPEMAKTLESINYPPLAEVFLGFKSEQVARKLDGFGFLVPKVEQRKILGSIWASTLFANRAPDGCVAFTSFVGGSRNPELVALDDAQLSALVVDELNSLVGIQGSPVLTKVNRWEHAIPQYNIGYHTVLSAIDRFEQNFHGAYICCNYRGGIAVGDCLMSAKKVADRVVSQVHNLSTDAFL